MAETKKTPLYNEHVFLKAKMVDFHGWQMPLYYRGITPEVKSVREKAGLFDLSHMGEIIIKGEGALSFLQLVTTNDVAALETGQMQYSFFLNHQGIILDDFMLYRLEDGFMAVVNAVNTEKIFEYLKSQQSGEVVIDNLTLKFALIGLQGPDSEKILQGLVGEKNLSGLKYLQVRKFNLIGEKVLISRSGYTGEDGFEIYPEGKSAARIWEAVLKQGKTSGLEPAGLGARDILRCEMGYPLYGQEWIENITPWEGGFSWAVKLNKDFIGKDALLKSKDAVTLKLIGFVMKEKAVPRTGYPLKYDGKNIGRVTSGTFSPTRGEFIGLGYVDKDFAYEGRRMNVEIRGKSIPAEIVKLPFVKSQVKR